MDLLPTEESEFSHETRMLVLNFMSLIPTDVSQHSSSSGSLASSGSLERNRKLLQDQVDAQFQDSDMRERGVVDGPSWQQTLPSLPETTLMDRVMERVNDDTSETIVAHVGDDDDDDEQGVDEPDMVQRPTNLKLRTRNAAAGGSQDSNSQQKGQNSPPRKKSSLSQKSSLDRQASNLSSSSDGTDATDVSSLMLSSRSCVSQRSNFVDVQYQDLDPLVRQGVLPPQVLPLQQQLNREMNTLHQQFSVKGKSPSPVPKATSSRNPTPPPPLTPSVSVMTPQSEVAEQLRIIGDSVQVEYGTLVEKAFQSVMLVPKSQLSYSFIEKILLELTEQIPALSQRAAVVMLLSQRLAMYGRDLHSLVNYTVRFLTDRMASFILSKGGWSSILALDEPPVTPGDISVTVPQTDIVDGYHGDLGVPLPPLHTVSTSSSTLVGDDSETQEVVASLVDSGFLAGSSTQTGPMSIGRDTTLDSIASLPHDMKSPSDYINSMTGSRQDLSSGVTSPENIDNGINITVNNVDSVGAGNQLCFTANDSSPNGTCNANSTTDNTEVDKVKNEIQLLRQLSDATVTVHDREAATEAATDMLQVAGLVFLGSTLACCAAFFVYKKAKNT